MAHKFKIGDAVNYRPGRRAPSAASGVYSVTGLLPVMDGHPEYRIKHFNEEFERVVQEYELSAA
jgi:hypothetical protein